MYIYSKKRFSTPMQEQSIRDIPIYYLDFNFSSALEEFSMESMNNMEEEVYMFVFHFYTNILVL